MELSNMRLRVEKVNKSKRKREIKEIYMTSFSKEDRMPFSLMLLMSYLWNTEFLAFYDDILCGLVYMATIGKQSFIMFIAVKDHLHSQGYGSHMLEMVQSLYPSNKIIVSIEPCEDRVEDYVQRVKRKDFYLKNGYFEAGYFIKLGGKKQEILIRNGMFNKLHFLLFFMFYSGFTVIPQIWKKDNDMIQ
jgi:GNAT superfamily N-acetyltransferase